MAPMKTENYHRFLVENVSLNFNKCFRYAIPCHVMIHDAGSHFILYIFAYRLTEHYFQH